MFFGKWFWLSHADFLDFKLELFPASPEKPVSHWNRAPQLTLFDQKAAHLTAVTREKESPPRMTASVIKRYDLMIGTDKRPS